MLAKQIRTSITDKGIKFAVIANRIDVPTATFPAMMNGKSKIILEEYFAICKAPSISNSYFTSTQKRRG